MRFEAQYTFDLAKTNQSPLEFGYSEELNHLLHVLQDFDQFCSYEFAKISPSVTRHFVIPSALILAIAIATSKKYTKRIGELIYRIIVARETNKEFIDRVGGISKVYVPLNLARDICVCYQRGKYKNKFGHCR